MLGFYIANLCKVKGKSLTAHLFDYTIFEARNIFTLNKKCIPGFHSLEITFGWQPSIYKSALKSIKANGLKSIATWFNIENAMT